MSYIWCRYKGVRHRVITVLSPDYKHWFPGGGFRHHVIYLWLLVLSETDFLTTLLWVSDTNHECQTPCLGKYQIWWVLQYNGCLTPILRERFSSDTDFSPVSATTTWHQMRHETASTIQCRSPIQRHQSDSRYLTPINTIFDSNFSEFWMNKMRQKT